MTEFLVGKHNSSLSLLPLIAMSYMNVPYIYGGKSPLDGLDCSGLVCELLQSVGALGANEDHNSQGLFNHFKDKSTHLEIALGCLAFYGKSITEISHVAMFLDTHLVIEAGHGTSETKSEDQAAKRDAKVRIRPFNYRKDLIAILRPKYEDYGLHD